MNDMNEKQVNKKEVMKKSAKEKTALVTIPEDQLNDYEKVVEVSINGHVWNILRGVMVEVPLSVAIVLKEAQYITDYKVLN